MPKYRLVLYIDAEHDTVAIPVLCGESKIKLIHCVERV